MDEQFEFLRSMVERLTRVRIPYMLTGSLALAIWARPRMTRDIDLVIDADHAAVTRLVAACIGDCYVSPAAAAESVASLSMFNVIHFETLLKADLILRRDDTYERTKFDRRRAIDVDGFSLDVISPEDLILSKLTWARDSESARQWDDVRLLLHDVRPLDDNYLLTWAEHLGVSDRLQQLRER